MSARLKLYLWGVIAVGVALSAHHVLSKQLDGAPLPTLVLLVALTIGGELSPIEFKRANQTSVITVSTTFSFALLLMMGPLAAILAQTLATAADDLRDRKPIWKSAFNVSQYVISLTVAGFVLGSLVPIDRVGAIAEFDITELVGIAAAGLAFFFTNHVLVSIAVTLAQRINLRDYLREAGSDLLFTGSADMILMSLSPIILVAYQEHLLLVPLLALPLVAVHKSVRISLEKADLVSDLQDQAARNEYQAMHDSLTGLPNRLMFHRRLEEAIVQRDTGGGSVAVMLMDLDRFKEVNDALGHAAGDILLQVVAERLRSAVRAGDTVGRLGGDEFAVIASSVKGPVEAAAVAERLLEVFQEPFELKGVHLHLTSSIGIALLPGQASDATSLLQHSDVAMYLAKSTGAGYEFYSAEHDYHSPARLAMVDDLRRAIVEDQLILHYQPKVNLADNTIVGVEALSRWQHPRRGLIMPQDFIQLAEQAGLIGMLTESVIRSALRRCAEWRSEGLDMKVAVNLSLQSIINLGLPTTVAETLQEFEVPASALTLEITETSMMADPRRTQEILEQLDQMGVRLSVDDFGTGYSSLSYLRRLPISEIKIDKSFVLDILVEESNRVIAQSTLDLGRNLGMDVVAEGVGDAKIQDTLTSLGCELMQGFHIARPMDATSLEMFFEASTFRPRRLEHAWEPRLVRGDDDLAATEDVHPDQRNDGRQVSG